MTAARIRNITASEDALESLLARIKAGDQRAFGDIYSQFERQVFLFAYRMLGSRDDADDIKQQTFLKAYLSISIGSFRRACSLQSWLLKICANLCRDRIRSWERRRISYDSTLFENEGVNLPADDDCNPAVIAEKEDAARQILRILDGLPEDHKNILLLYGVKEFSYDEIAEQLGCTRGGVKLRLYRARKAVRERAAAESARLGQLPAAMM